MVIVTQNQYILADKIHHVTLDENIDYHDGHMKGRLHTFIEKHYQITIIYTPKDTSSSGSIKSSGGEMRECAVILRDAVNAYSVFKDLIQQIREQIPDELYLDQALQRMIAGLDMESIKDKDDSDRYEAEVKYDRKSTQVRRPRKAKRRNKKVLRRSKGRNSRR